MTNPSEIHLVDTHALVWYLTEDRKLPRQVVRLLQAAERGEHEVLVPTIVLAEGMAIEEKRRTMLSKGRILDWVLTHRALVVVEFDLPTVLEMNELSAGMELHDRIIAATARLFGAVVLTRDRVIAACVDTLWGEAIDTAQGEQPS